MSNPLLVNQTPIEGTTDVSADTPFRVGVRDADSHVDLSSLYIALLYARAVYVPAVELPENDDVLNASTEVIEVDFTVFNDAAGSTLPMNPADQTMEVVGLDTVYRIERTGGTQEGFLYISDSIEGLRPVEAAARFSIDSVIPGGGYGSYDYVTYTDFTGVVFGLIYWPRNTGLFLFFRDDGIAKYITVAGPSEDGIGTRTSVADVVFDWSAAAYTYKIVWDETTARRDALVLAVDPATGDETILATADVTTLAVFLTSVHIGPDEAEDPPQRVAMVLGTDGPTAGDSIDVYKTQLFRFGGAVVIDGNRAQGTVVGIVPTDAFWLTSTTGTGGWIEEGTGTISTTDALTITREEAADGSGLRQITRTEPVLATREWVLIAQYKAADSTHVGTYDIGMGFTIEDGTSAVQVRLYDDFSTHNTGILASPTATGDLAVDYTFGSSAIEWADDMQLVLVGSNSRNEVRAHFGLDDEVATILASYNPADYPASTDTSVSVGFVRSGAFYGTFTVNSFLLLPDCALYEPLDATYPDAQGWTRSTAGTVTRAITSNRLSLSADAVGAYDVYSLMDADYNETSGATWFAKLAISARVDSTGTNTARKAFGPVLLTALDATAAMLYFVQADDGTVYAYIPAADLAGDLASVIAQDERGRAISTAINIAQQVVFILETKPFNYIRLFVNYSTTAAIEVLWGSEGFALPTFPTPVPVGTSVAFGMLSDTSALTMEVAFARVSFGTGYDISVRFDASEEVLQGHIYGSDVDVLVDFQDADP